MKDLIQLRRLTLGELIALCCGFSVAINACLIAVGLNVIGFVVGAAMSPTDASKPIVKPRAQSAKYVLHNSGHH